MATILYVFPHPDDESFGPAPVLARQRREGHAVHLLTLSRGEATSQREKFGLSLEEMGAQREREMRDVAGVLDLTDLTVLDFPDGGFRELDPLDLEAAVRAHVEAVRPDVLVTYAVHGVSGHPDHLVGHAIVKRVYCALRREGSPFPRRLALFTLRADADADRPAHLKGSPDAHIDAAVSFTDADLARGRSALDCYVTYRDVIVEHQPLDHIGDRVVFEFFGEDHDPPLDSLFAGLGG